MGCERAGLDSLEAEHKAVIVGGASIGCGVSLDQCRKPHEPDAPRWDYVFVRRDDEQGIAIEVHHAHPNEVVAMIDKKRWAEDLMARCPNIRVSRWVWVASPPNGEILFLPQSPIARRLAEAQIEFPKMKCVLP
ncbi:MAG TPA: hypothetical protein VFK02_04510 [Kofleriaceae bacterium]|nr:hypothetical protein [Kofleriaceae bacterium]